MSERRPPWLSALLALWKSIPEEVQIATLRATRNREQADAIRTAAVPVRKLRGRYVSGDALAALKREWGLEGRRRQLAEKVGERAAANLRAKGVAVTRDEDGRWEVQR